MKGEREREMDSRVETQSTYRHASPVFPVPSPSAIVCHSIPVGRLAPLTARMSLRESSATQPEALAAGVGVDILS